MPELLNPNPTPQGATPTNGANPTNPQGGQEPTNPAGGTQPISTLTDEQLAEAFKHPRFKGLIDSNKTLETQLKELQDAKTAQEKKDLEEAGKFKDLYDKENASKTQLEQKLEQISKERAIEIEALKLGITDTDAVIKLADMGSVKLDKEGKVENASEVVKALLEAKPYLATGATPTPNTIGANTNNNNGNQLKPIYKMAELQEKLKDHAWYKENKDEVQLAIKEGRVVN